MACLGTAWLVHSGTLCAGFRKPIRRAHSLRLHHPAGTHAFVVSDPKNPIRTHRGKAYLISFWARTANEKEPGVFYLEAFSSVNPYKSVASPLRRPIEPTSNWRHYHFQVDEGKDFVADQSRFFLLAFRPTRSDGVAQTLWIDGVSVTEVPSTAESLPTLRDIAYPPLNHRLRPGPSLSFEVDAERPLGPVTRQAAGISFHRIAGWGRHPHDDAGNRVLEPELIRAIADLRLPMTRFYGVGDHEFSVEVAIDKIVEVCRECGIPQQWTVLELEPHTADRSFGTEFYRRAVTHSIKKGYRFRYWEICNEPYTRKSTAFENPDQYVQHVKEISKTIRSVQSDGQVGIGIYSKSQPWGTYVLKEAAGHYDFVVGHYYDGTSPYTHKVQDIALGSNYAMLDHVLNVNAMIASFNPGKAVYQLDTEWGQSGAAKGDNSTASRYWRNANIVGTLHRAVRLIYYVREGMLRGASGWEMFAREKNVTFGHLTRDAPDSRYLLYWLYFHFNRHCGDVVLDLNGTAPWYDEAGEESAGPFTPVLASLGQDGREMYLVIANGSWDHSYPCRVGIANFKAETVSGRFLCQDNRDANPLVKHESEVVADLPVTLGESGIEFTVPSHSVVFITLR